MKGITIQVSSSGANKMKAHRTFVRGDDELLREAHARLRRLITITHGITKQQMV